MIFIKITIIVIVIKIITINMIKIKTWTNPSNCFALSLILSSSRHSTVGLVLCRPAKTNHDL